MALYIEDKRLEDLLASHERDIGSSPFESLPNIFSALICLFQYSFATFSVPLNIPGSIINIILVILGVAYFLYGAFNMYSSLTNKYSHSDLCKSIRDLDEKDHPFSIIAIKDSFNEYPNRFLLYHDNGWDCDFFFNFRTRDNERDNTENIRKALANKLKVNEDDIAIEYKTEEVHTKYSQTDKYTKRYRHRLYQATIKDFPPILKRDTFSIDGIQYRWCTISDMMTDADIQDKNLDVVSLVKNNVA